MAKKFDVQLESWESVYALSRELSEIIKKDGFHPDLVIALARGGWVAGRNLCDFLGIKDLVSLKVEHWGVTATPDGEAVLKYPFDLDLSGKKVLVVDDVTDTGESLRVSMEYVKGLKPKEVKSATLHSLEGTKFEPDFFAKKMKWIWILYPWCWTEDMVNLVGNVMENGKKQHIKAVQKGLEDHYKIKVDQEELHKIMIEMERRDIVDRIEEEVLHWRKK